MCYGSNCKWEIVSGPSAGECRRPPGKKGVCDAEDYDDETPPKMTTIPTISSMTDELEEAQVCSCFPEHCCMLDEHGPCWCGGYLIQAEDNTIIYVHNQES